MPEDLDHKPEEKETQGIRRRKKRNRSDRGSQTSDMDEDCSSACGNCQSMADLVKIMNEKLDTVLARTEDLENIRLKQAELEKENSDLRESLDYAHADITMLKESVKEQEVNMAELREEVGILSKVLRLEQQRAIKLECHSRRDNLNFFNIPEKPGEDSFLESEKVLRNFFLEKLGVEESLAGNISIERVHRVGQKKEGKVRPLIAKFSFFKDREYIRSQAKNLAGSNFGLSEDYPREIVEARRILVPKLKDAKKKGLKARLVLDKLYINGQLVE